MAVNIDNWIQLYDIPDTSKHKKGFTLYKIISILYPKNCPDAVTKITVWKRFNDIKGLHKDMKHRHQSLYLKDKFPLLPKTSFFKRFEDDVIEQRKLNALTLLDFIAAHPQLFKSNEFVKFFETSHTPQELLSTSINSIRAKLHLPMDAEISTVRSTHSDDDLSLSDTDSISTLSSLSPSVQGLDLMNDPLYKSTASLTKLSKKLSSDLSSSTSITSKTTSSDSHDSLNLQSTENGAASDAHIFPTPPTTPDCFSLSLNNNIQYITDSEKYVALATDYESKHRFEEAFAAYKQAISLLLNGVKVDSDVNRRQMVRFKTEKYLLRAEKIYNIHLSSELNIIRELTISTAMSEHVQPLQKVIIPKQLSELHKYKVLKIVGSGMLALHSELQQLHFIKVIQTSANYEKTKAKTILPKDVPYMIKLHNYYQYDDAIFLILEYSSGNKLSEYIKERFCACGDTTFNSYENEMKDFQYKRDGSGDCLDGDSDCSYSDLINEYVCVSKDALQIFPASSKSDCNEEILPCDDDELFDEDDTSTAGSVNSQNQDDASNKELDKLETNQLLLKSQKLLTTVESTLHETKKNQRKRSQKKKNDATESVKNVEKCPKENNAAAMKQRKFSDKSLSADFEYFPNVVVPHKLAVKWSSQLLIALECLHQQGVICGYLCLNHVLIDEKDNVQLTYKSNVNTNKLFFDKYDANLAPDLYLCNEPTIASDWWCYGAVLYELLTGLPLRSGHPEGLSSFTALRIPRYVSAEGKSLLKQVLTYEPHDRLGCGINGTEDLKSHPFFHSIDWEKLYTDAKYT